MRNKRGARQDLLGIFFLEIEWFPAHIVGVFYGKKKEEFNALMYRTSGSYWIIISSSIRI